MSDRHKTLGEYRPAGPKVRVGADLDSWCTRCRMVLTHTNMAMEAGEVLRVKCNTCGSEHRHREAPPGQQRSRKVEKSSGTWAPAPPKRPARAWQAATAGKDLGNPIAYHPKSTFELGQVILHGKFGLGVVMGVKPDAKIYVVFEDDTRTLIHARP